MAKFKTTEEHLTKEIQELNAKADRLREETAEGIAASQRSIKWAIVAICFAVASIVTLIVTKLVG